MTKSVSFILTMACLLLASPLRAQDDSGERFVEANKAYQAKDYQRAVELYQSLLDDGYRSAGLYHNLGNSYYRLGRPALAVLQYERGLLLAPRDQDLRHNLEVVRAGLPDELESIPTFFLKRWWNALLRTFPSGGWAAIGLILLWAGLAGLGLWMLARKRRLRAWGFFLGLGLLIFSLPAFTLSFARKSMERHSGRAVIMVPEVNLRSAPDPESSSIMALHAGTTVELRDVIGDWHKVLLSNGDQGWLPATAVEEVRMGPPVESGQ